MLPNEWLEYIAQAQKELKRPPAPPKRRQPKITRHTSARMRIVGGQTSNPIRAMYQPENEYNATPLLPEKAETTREVGPNDRYNPTEGYRGGKATVEPTQSNKRHAPGRRAYGGGTNKAPSADAAAWLEAFNKKG
jgi:hypothetical protein